MTESESSTGNRIAAEGHIFVCCACGKTSTWKYGFDSSNKQTSSRGWDASCMLNAREFSLDHVVWDESKTRVVRIEEPGWQANYPENAQ
jgi:hypothetical protein